MKTILVWLLVFNGAGSSKGGNSFVTVNNLPSYEECVNLGKELSNGHRNNTGYVFVYPKYTCHKIKQVIQ